MLQKHKHTLFRVSSLLVSYNHVGFEGNNKYIMRSWEWRRGAKFAHVSHESMYQNGSAILVVPQAGLYNVYIHTTFYAFGQAEEEW